MKPSTRLVVGFASAWMAVVGAVISAQPASGTAPAAVPQDENPPRQPALNRSQRADRVINLSCSVVGCHTARLIETSAMDREGWTKTVNLMIEKGAKLENDEDKDILIESLVRDHGPLPEGEGRKILLNVCTICHDLQRVRSRLFTPDGWKAVLEEMIIGGAPLTDDTFPILLTYLSRNFRPRQ
jgi:cytochrome c5